MLLPGVEPSDQQVPLEAESQSASRLDWFVDGEYLGSAAADERIWWTPRPGTHEILVADQGLASRRSLEVRWRP
jgi:penicillin-binding protein 1C